MNTKIIILFVTLMLVTKTHAFDWDKCADDMVKYPQVVDTVISSSQFSSSWGGCSLMGSIDHRKKAFFVHNLNHIQSDSARGQGEYLSAYAAISGCSKIASHKLKNALQSNFTLIYGSELEYSPRQAYEQIEQLISDDPELRVSCKPRA